MNREFSRSDVILIVDDNPANLGVLSELLDNAGMEILVAQDGESALQKAVYDPPDLILLDVMMPGIDGFEVCQRLKTDTATSDVPVILMTALSDPGSKVKGLHLGAVDYITKPFEQEEVLARVETHLQLRRLAKQLQAQNQRLTQEVEERSAAEAALHTLTQELEQRVQERTAELSQTLQQLRQSQVSLVQKEKMSILGELVAGIAHELNNPIGCMVGNLKHASTYFTDLSNLLKLYQKHYPQPHPEIGQEIETIELDYLLEDLPSVLASMNNGTERVQQLVHSLRNFSRRDESSKQPINIHEGIDSTLMILQHRLKANAERLSIKVEKEYGSLPLVQCYPGPLNQVFMNLLANAIDALEEAIDQQQMNEKEPLISICTELHNNQIVIVRITDNGLGMTDEVKQRLSEPMFTTKPVGKGTGLGLSISRQIVEERHGGSLKWQSQPGQGSEFWIEIPCE